MSSSRRGGRGPGIWGRGIPGGRGRGGGREDGGPGSREVAPSERPSSFGPDTSSRPDQGRWSRDFKRLAKYRDLRLNDMKAFAQVLACPWASRPGKLLPWTGHAIPQPSQCALQAALLSMEELPAGAELVLCALGDPKDMYTGEKHALQSGASQCIIMRARPLLCCSASLT